MPNLIPSPPWTPNLTVPFADQGFQNGDRSDVGNPLYAPFSVQITQPQAGITTASRYRKQHPGIEYNVKVGAYGGDFSALRYSLTTAPLGMVINPLTGEISWPNPVEAGSPHTIAVEVSDGLTTDTRSWDLEVTTVGILFVDINTPTSGVGTINDPLKDVPDWFLDDKNDDTYAGQHVYYRSGTYTPDSTDKDARGSLTLSNADKPVVHMAYPGETAVFDMSLGFFFTDTQIHDVYVDGIDFINVGDFVSSGEGVWGFRLFGDRHVYRRGSWSGLNDIVGSNNQAYIMAVQSSSRNEHWLISENAFDGNNANGYACNVTYWSTLCVIESNEIVNGALIGYGFKINNVQYALRGNRAEGTGRLFNAAMENASNALEGNSEISWNYGNGALAAVINFGLNGATQPIYYIRNTFTAAFDIVGWDDPAYGDLYFIHNVLVSATGVLYTTSTTVDASKIIDTDNLINTTETNFLDPVTGLLIGSFESQNATRGHGGLAGLK